MRILELTNYSAGIDGVFARVKEEALRLAQLGHEVKIFSSNHVKGSQELAAPHELINGVEIRRFSARKLGGESFMRWNFKASALTFKPNVIIAHAFRHSHTLKALSIAKKLKCKVFLVTHAPFARSATRTFFQKKVVSLYDFFIAKRTLKQFTKIILVAKWEIPYLLKLGIKKGRICYIPNGIPEEFFTQKATTEEENKIIFIGRIAPIKNLETAIKALPLIYNKKIKLEIIGPSEEAYLNQLKKLINEQGMKKRVLFSPPIYEIAKKIKKIDSALIFILPSQSEGMPQGLIEAMARSKIVIASNNLGAKDLIQNNKNGFLFTIGNEKDCAIKLNKILALKEKSAKKIKETACSSVKQFAWPNIIKKLENTIKKI